jgi:hypothetical protein
MNLHFCMSSRPALGSTQLVPRALFPGVKLLGRGADQSLPTGAEVKETWVYYLISLHDVMIN